MAIVMMETAKSDERACLIASGLFNLQRQRRSLSDLHNFRTADSTLARERDSFQAVAPNRAPGDSIRNFIAFHRQRNSQRRIS